MNSLLIKEKLNYVCGESNLGGILDQSMYAKGDTRFLVGACQSGINKMSYRP